ncbi:hypothetical protein GCM10010961_24240 [Pseudodonghicola xiamenensis]|uniref:Small-conductance mechanosensitive channel n=2 Tax=Pseudodonghicola xiamenensis TaxID=337702 RepID=A0A8J3MDU8_9RHOB|nr:hypothetical protein GCM10010961_24240 [Pseudodonghicola xiamenensis]
MVLRGMLALWLLVFMPLPGIAQSLLPTPGIKASTPAKTVEETAAEANLADALKQAAEAGVSVVVVNADGQQITSGGGSTPMASSAGAGAAIAGAGGGAAGEPRTMSGDSSMMKAQERIREFRETLDGRLKALPTSLNEVAYILRATSPDGRIATYVEVFFRSVLFILLSYGFISWAYGWNVARRFIVPLVKEAPDGYLEKMPFLVYRFLAGLIGTVLSLALALLMIVIVFGYSDDLSVQFTVTAIFATVFAVRTVSDLWRMILSPFLRQYRIPRFTDREARRLYYWASGLTAYNIVAGVFSTWIRDFGLNYNVYALLFGALSLVGAVGNLLMLAFNGGAIGRAIRNGRSQAEITWLTRMLVTLWAPVLAGYFIFTWLRLAYQLVLELPMGLPPIVSAYASFVAILIVYAAINYAIEHYFARSHSREALNEELTEAEIAEGEEGPAAWLRAHRPVIKTYEQLARQVSGILAFVAGFYALVLIWDANSRLRKMPAVESLLDVMVILFIGYIVYHLFRIWIDTRIAEEVGDGEEAEMGDEGGMAGASRLATLLPLFRGAILAVVVVSIVLIALMELGVNVSPLFAGAGVVGLAVGFGSQTLVRDIFSGAFFLIDDAFRKGEYIDIGDVKGTVEKISVRSFQLRHHLGALHTIPFGEIKVLTNYSRDWVIMKLPLRVTYDTDVEKVRKLIKKLGERLLEDPVIGENFIQPLKSQGVIEMQDSAMIIRVKFMTKPGDQFLVRKRVYEEIRELFAREGVKFAHREVTVRLADGETKDLTHDQREAVAGAVQRAIDDGDLDYGGGSHGDDR